MANQPTNSGHPDAVAIDLLRTGEGSAADKAHLEGCPRCRQVLAELKVLAVELRGAQGTPIQIPDEVDRRVSWNARKRAAEIRRLDRRISPRYGWAAAAAVLLALGGLGLWQRGILAPVSAPSVRIAQGDIDADGRVDMVDALTLARVVERGGSLDPAWDVNGDGHVDGSDAAAVARRAVAIEGA